MTPRVVCIGGGHGLAVTLRACRPWAGQLTAIVSVADDGGSSGRLRADHPGLPAPGDVRRCLTTLAAPDRAMLAAALERRVDGHAVGNLVLLALTQELGDFDAAVAEVAATLGVAPNATVLPAATESVDLVGLVGLVDPDGGATREIRGQVAIEAAADRVRAVRLEPSDPDVPKAAIEAIDAADLVVLGPGSLYGSVLAAVVAPSIQRAVTATAARTVLVQNLRSHTSGDDPVEALRRHGVEPDVVIDATARIARPNGLAHDPDRLGAALRSLST